MGSLDRIKLDIIDSSSKSFNILEMKGTLIILSFAVIATSNAAPAPQWIDQILNVFGTTEEAPYTLVNKFENFEERLYPSKKWACTDYGLDANDSGFMHLFRYITGTNLEKKSIDMTVPVTMEKKDDKYTMCFFIGEIHQANPPTPSEESVYLSERPELSIYTREFSGYADEAIWVKEETSLRSLITGEGFTVKDHSAYRAGFDSPMKFWNRRNEVWLIKQ